MLLSIAWLGGGARLERMQAIQATAELPMLVLLNLGGQSVPLLTASHQTLHLKISELL